MFLTTVLSIMLIGLWKHPQELRGLRKIECQKLVVSLVVVQLINVKITIMIIIFTNLLTWLIECNGLLSTCIYILNDSCKTF